MVQCHERETHSTAWWLHQMETFSVYWRFVRRSPGNSPQKGQWRGTLIFSLICALNNRLNKQSRGWWFETPLWRHCNGILTRGKNDQSYFSDRWMMISINGTLVLRVIIKKIVIRCKVYSLGVCTFNLLTTIIIFVGYICMRKQMPKLFMNGIIVPLSYLSYINGWCSLFFCSASIALFEENPSAIGGFLSQGTSNTETTCELSIEKGNDAGGLPMSWRDHMYAFQYHKICIVSIFFAVWLSCEWHLLECYRM